jgi:rhodanese-related sulfurtransferase
LNDHIMRALTFLTPFFFLLLAASCTGQPSARDLNADEFERALNGGGTVQLVDVRTAGEYASGHLEGAKLMDWSNGQFQKEMATLDKDTPVLLYCASGRRSEAALNAMQEAGFKEVKHMLGGIQAWGRAGKAVVR